MTDSERLTQSLQDGLEQLRAEIGEEYSGTKRQVIGPGIGWTKDLSRLLNLARELQAELERDCVERVAEQLANEARYDWLEGR